MDNIYNNKFIVFSFVLLYSALFLNFGASTYMLNAPPIIIMDECETCAGYSLGPFIVVDKSIRPEYYYTVARHEYQHYMQQAVLTPAILFISYSAEFVLFGKSYGENIYEIDAFSKQDDGLVFKVFDLETLKIKTMSKEE